MTNSPLPQFNSVAIASLVFAFLSPPLGIALGAVARGEIRERGERGLALANLAIVVGGVLTGLIAVLLVVGAAGGSLIALFYLGLIPV